MHLFNLGLCALLLLVSTLRAGPTVWEEKNGNSVPDTAERKSKDGFGGWLLVTSDADWKQKWETSPETIPSFHGSHAVTKGNRLFILLFFIGPKLDGEGKGDITCDLQSVRPDSSVSIDQKNIVCLGGKMEGNPNNVYLSPAVIEFIGEPSDPTGKWTIRAVLRDKFRRVELPLETYFVLK